MQKMQTFVTNVDGVCLSVCPLVCLSRQLNWLGFTVWGSFVAALQITLASCYSMNVRIYVEVVLLLSVFSTADVMGSRSRGHEQRLHACGFDFDLELSRLKLNKLFTLDGNIRTHRFQVSCAPLPMSARPGATVSFRLHSEQWFLTFFTAGIP